MEVIQVGICFMEVSQVGKYRGETGGYMLYEGESGKKSYSNFLQVVEVVSNADRDLTGRVALIRLVVSINTQHLHSSLPPGQTHNNMSRGGCYLN